MSRKPIIRQPESGQYWLVLHCRVCGAEVSHPVLPQRLRAGIRTLGGEDLIPAGAYLAPADPRDGRGPDWPDSTRWRLNLADFVGSDAGATIGCCGADGSMKNLSCSAGHPLGYQNSDCWMPAYASLPAAGVRAEFRPIEDPSPEAFEGAGQAMGGFRAGIKPPVAGAVPLGVAWDESESRRAFREEPKSSRRWAARSRTEPWAAIYWCDARPGEPTATPVGMVPMVLGGTCYPMDIRRVSPSPDGLSATISAALPDGLRLRLNDPLWPLYPDVWQCDSGPRHWVVKPIQAWVRLAGTLLRMELDPEGRPEALEPDHAKGNGHRFAGRFLGWERTGESLSQPWRSGWLEFQGYHLRRLQVWESGTRLQKIPPGAKVHGRVALQGVFERPAYWKGNFEFEHDGVVCSLLRAQALFDPEARHHMVRDLVASEVGCWVGRGLAGGARASAAVDQASVAGELACLLEGWLEHGRGLPGMKVLLARTFPKKSRGRGAEIGELMDSMLSAGLVDPDRVQAADQPRG